MSKSYKVAKKTINMGDKKGQTVYSVRPYSYGTLTTEEVANQIAVESTATPADVKAVLDRYAYYVKENLKKGYDIELLGFGKLFIRFITGKAVEDESKANAKLVKYGEEKKDKTTDGTTDEEKKPTTGDTTQGGGSENTGGTGSENGDSGDLGL